MKADVVLTLPYPPTGNHAWKHTKMGRHYLTTQARQYYEMVVEIVRQQGACMGLEGALTVECDIYPPDRRRRDLDNAWKVLSDACTKAGIWVDDTQINKLVLERMDRVEHGRVLIRVMQNDENVVTC